MVAVLTKKGLRLKINDALKAVLQDISPGKMVFQKAITD